MRRALVLALVSQLCTVALARRPPPLPCGAGEFAVAPADLIKLVPVVGASTISLATDRTITLGACSGIATIKAKRTVTVVTARFATCGPLQKVKLSARMPAPGCQTVLAVLKAKRLKAVHFSATRNAIPTSTSTTTTTTTTLPSMQAFCGNGTLDGSEACEGVSGCGPGSQCTASCACELAPASPQTARDLIAARLHAGQIDYATSLVYRAWALFGDGRLPAELDGDVSVEEDARLVPEISKAWATLAPDVQAELRPFIVRPTDPASYFSAQPPAAGASARAARDVTPAVTECPLNPNTGTADWRATGAGRFVVWSCGGGDPAQDPTAPLRQVVATLVQDVYAKLQPKFGDLRDDNYPSTGPLPNERIDVYVVERNQCKPRTGGCVLLPPPGPGGTVLAKAVPAPPCSAGAGGPHRSSGYLLMARDQVEGALPPSGSVSELRYHLAHEMFHLYQYALNLDAISMTCGGETGITDLGDASWLDEASAEWAAASFFPADGHERRNILFSNFQARWDQRIQGLLAVGSEAAGDQARSYEAYIYPYFVQEQAGADAFAGVWTGSAGVRTPVQLTDRLASVFSFVDNFRDFTVRNLNTNTLTGNPISPLHHDSDGALPVGNKPPFLQPPLLIPQPMTDQAFPVDVAPLAAQYLDVDLPAPALRWFKFDASDLASVDLDAIVQRTDGTWERRKVEGGVLTFCRDDKPKDDINHLWVVLSNHDHHAGARVTGSMKVTAKLACPATWNGQIEYLLTDDEDVDSTDINEHEIISDHRVERQTWTVRGVSHGPLPNGPLNVEADFLDLTWHAVRSREDYTAVTYAHCVGGTSLATQTAYGEHTDQSRLLLGAGPSVAPVETGKSFQVDAPNYFEDCTGASGTAAGTDVVMETLGYIGIAPGIGGVLTPDPGNPNSFHGDYTIFDNTEVEVGGQRRLKAALTWGLTRHPSPTP